MRSDEAGAPSEDLTPTLVVRLREGDAAAGAWLDRLYRPRLAQFCRRKLGNVEEAEDAVQDVFARVLRERTVPDDFRAWVYRIARNHCLDRLRRRGRRRDDRTLPTEPRIAGRPTGDLTRLVRRETRERVARIVASLDPSQREVLHLRYTDGLSRAEIAHVLGLPESIVKSRIYEGLRKLRSHASLLDSTS